MALCLLHLPRHHEHRDKTGVLQVCALDGKMQAKTRPVWYTAHPTSRIRRCNSWVNATANGHARPCPIMKAYASCLHVLRQCLALLCCHLGLTSADLFACRENATMFVPGSPRMQDSGHVAHAASPLHLQHAPHGSFCNCRTIIPSWAGVKPQGLSLQRAAGQVGTSMTWVTVSQPNRGRNIRQCGLRAP